MVEVRLGQSKNGCLHYCSSSGHALFAKKGSDIVCAAITTLLRTVLLVLQEEKNLEIEVLPLKRGELSFKINNADNKDFLNILQFAYIFLKKGLESIENDYPKHLRIDFFIE